MSEARTDPRLSGVCLLDVRQVADLLGVHSRTVWRMATMGEIPKPIKLSERVVRWRLTDLQRHIEKARPSA